MASNATATVACDVRDLALADRGKRRIEWAFQSMPVLQTIRKQFIKAQPFADLRISVCLHVTSETANLLMTLRDGGATITLCASNPLSTQDDVAASLARDYNIGTFAISGESAEVHEAHIAAAIEARPHVTVDDGSDLTTWLHTKRSDLLEGMLAGTEQSATGVSRLNAMVRQGALKYPVIAVNEARTRMLFDSRHGTGQSTVDGIIRATNLLLAGLNVVVAGYGWCGRGIAMRARGLGANVIITEIEPSKAIEAVMDGYRVMTMSEAAAIGDVFVTATGNKNVIARDQFERLKGGAILCNAGHDNVEIDLPTLAKMASSKRQAKESVDEYKMRDGRSLFVLAEGRLVNLAAAEGHSASVMDMSFATQALCLDYLVRNHESLEKKCLPVPDEIDRQVARVKLEAMSIKIDRLTPEQEAYLAGWSEAT